MRIGLFVTFAIGLSVTAAPAQNEGAKSDLEKLQGAWTVTSYEDGDDKADAEDLKGWTYTFKGNKVAVTLRGQTDPAETFKINEGKTPKEMDIVGLDGVRGTGIYQLDGDQLTIRIYFTGAARPKSIKGPLNNGETRFVFKRQKK